MPPSTHSIRPLFSGASGSVGMLPLGPELVEHAEGLFHYNFGGTGGEGRCFDFVASGRIGATDRQIAEAAVGVTREERVRKGRAGGDLLADFNEWFAGYTDERDGADPDALQLPVDVGATVIEAGAVGTHAGLSGHGGGVADFGFGSFLAELGQSFTESGGFDLGLFRGREGL